MLLSMPEDDTKKLDLNLEDVQSHPAAQTLAIGNELQFELDADKVVCRHKGGELVGTLPPLPPHFAIANLTALSGRVRSLRRHPQSSAIVQVQIRVSSSVSSNNNTRYSDKKGKILAKDARRRFLLLLIAIPLQEDKDCLRTSGILCGRVC